MVLKNNAKTNMSLWKVCVKFSVLAFKREILNAGGGIYALCKNALRSALCEGVPLSILCLKI